MGKQVKKEEKVYITAYMLIKEFAEEEGIEVKLADENAEKQPIVKDGKAIPSEFMEFKNKQIKNLKEILQKVNLLEKFSVMKNGQRTEIRIPVEYKESIKLLLKNFTTPVSRKIRKEKTEKVTFLGIIKFYQRNRKAY